MIHVIIGTKAQLIKMAPIMRRLQDLGIPYNYISTGQHKDTMEEILDNFELKKPDVHLYQGRDITAIPQMAMWSLRILWKVLFNRAAVFRQNNKDKSGIVLVHGDTFSTLLGALMGKLAGLKVGHVESGLRSYNWFQPFPEELTRLATFRLSDFMFCPGQWAVENLKPYSGEKVNTDANTLLDSLSYALPGIKKLPGDYVPTRSFGIVTLHRFENFRDEDSTRRIVECVEQIAKTQDLLFILHKPTEINLRKYGFYERLRANPRIEMRPRYDYFKFIKLLLGARFVISDGGSNQEECYYLGKPVLLLRNVTERKEGLGRNAVISQFDPKVIDEFLGSLDRYTFDLLNQEKSPSAVIVETCRPFVGAAIG
ncbi:UDP-N-acetylglucosamine 2-epimerase [Bdellovibrionota bacterium FG-2]